MASGDNAAFIKRQSDYDLVVVGGGICGCWIAYKAGRAGLKTLLVEKDQIGAGASGGLLGALMPHMPERWDGKKQFQFEALHNLPTEIAELEAQTNISCGYRRTGRIAPIMNATKRGQMLGHTPDVEKYWLGEYNWQILDETPVANWPIAEKATHGVVHDTLTARVNPRGLLASLKQALIEDQNVTLFEGIGLERFDRERGVAALDDKSEIAFSHIVIAAGVETFDFIAPQLDVAIRALGKPIKGQAATISADIDPDWPILFDDGVYIISHGQGRVAIGSTSELEFDEPFSTDRQLDELIIKAGNLCPALRDAEVIERWAGLRPRAIGRDPLVDGMPDAENILIATSGFKITFGVAHKMADVVIEHVLGKRLTNVPESFSISAHLAKAKRAENQDNYL